MCQFIHRFAISLVVVFLGLGATLISFQGIVHCLSEPLVNTTLQYVLSGLGKGLYLPLLISLSILGIGLLLLIFYAKPREDKGTLPSS